MMQSMLSQQHKGEQHLTVVLGILVMPLYKLNIE